MTLRNPLDRVSFTTSTTTASEPLTLDKLKEAMAAIESLGPEPLGEYMRKQGMPPEEGYRLLLPETCRELVGPFVPLYVGFTTSSDAPLIYMDTRQWLLNRSFRP